ncbi:MAG: glutaredoxin family protein [Chromatiales bacterium]|jgi:glutaredoxin
MHSKHKTAKVVLYTTLNCPHCQNAKRWFNKNNIPFLDFNVGKPGMIQKQFFQLGGRSVPLIVIGDQQLRGFDPKRLTAVLTEYGLFGHRKASIARNG